MFACKSPIYRGLRHLCELYSLDVYKRQAGIRTSVFVSTDAEMIEYAAKAGADRVELYTEPYATAYPKGCLLYTSPFITVCLSFYSQSFYL